MGAEDFKPNNESLDSRNDEKFAAAMDKLEDLRKKEYPDDFKDHLKTTIPQLYEEVIKLDANADTDMEKVMRMILDDLDRALRVFDGLIQGEVVPAAPEKTTAQRRADFLTANEAKFNKNDNEFYTKEVNKDGSTKSMTMTFKDKSPAYYYLQIQDIVIDTTATLTKSTDSKVYKWDNTKNSFCSNGTRLLIHSGDVINFIKPEADTVAPAEPVVEAAPSPEAQPVTSSDPNLALISRLREFRDEGYKESQIKETNRDDLIGQIRVALAGNELSQIHRDELLADAEDDGLLVGLQNADKKEDSKRAETMSEAWDSGYTKELQYVKDNFTNVSLSVDSKGGHENNKTVTVTVGDKPVEIKVITPIVGKVAEYNKDNNVTITSNGKKYDDLHSAIKSVTENAVKNPPETRTNELAKKFSLDPTKLTDIAYNAAKDLSACNYKVGEVNYNLKFDLENNTVSIYNGREQIKELAIGVSLDQEIAKLNTPAENVAAATIPETTEEFPVLNADEIKSTTVVKERYILPDIDGRVCTGKFQNGELIDGERKSADGLKTEVGKFVNGRLTDGTTTYMNGEIVTLANSEITNCTLSEEQLKRIEKGTSALTAKNGSENTPYFAYENDLYFADSVKKEKIGLDTSEVMPSIILKYLPAQLNARRSALDSNHSIASNVGNPAAPSST